MVGSKPSHKKTAAFSGSLGASAGRRGGRVRPVGLLPARPLERPVVPPDGVAPLDTGALAVAT